MQNYIVMSLYTTLWAASTPKAFLMVFLPTPFPTFIFSRELLQEFPQATNTTATEYSEMWRISVIYHEPNLCVKEAEMRRVGSVSSQQHQTTSLTVVSTVAARAHPVRTVLTSATQFHIYCCV